MFYFKYQQISQSSLKNSFCFFVDDESDEHDSVCKDQTPNCPGNERSCGNRQCIPAIWWCDTEEDCIDGSDEANCDASKWIIWWQQWDLINFIISRKATIAQ